MTDQLKHDAGKPRLSLVPPGLIEAVGYIRTYGAKLYGDDHSWQLVVPERYRDAMMRHLVAYMRNPAAVDVESGYPHLWHLACNAAFLIELAMMPAEEVTVIEPYAPTPGVVAMTNADMSNWGNVDVYKYNPDTPDSKGEYLRTDSQQTVQEQRLEAKRQGKEYVQCAVCGKKFIAKSYNQIYCTYECQQAKYAAKRRAERGEL